MSREIEEIRDAAGAYRKWALEARKKYIELRLRQDLEIRGLYIRAADRVAQELRKLALKTPSSYLRKQQLEELEAALRMEAERLSGNLTKALETYIEEAVNAGAGYSQAVTLGLFKKAGIETTGLRTLFATVNRQAVEACWARTKNGLFLSDRIWEKSEKFRATMRDLIQEAVAIGQDAVKTARMLQRYVRQGAQTLARDYPNMMERMKGRIPGDICYEALRLARTETTAAFGEGTIAAARVSPSYKGMKWVLSKSHPLVDICDTLAAHDEGFGRGIYSPGNEPPYPAHPNCLCVLVPVHEEPEDFVERLKRWRDNPGSDQELEKWYNTIYKGPVEYIPTSLGAAARRIYVKSPLKVGKAEYIKEGTYVTKIKTIAAGKEIRDIQRLIETYTLPNGKLTKPDDWKKMRGEAIITDGENDWLVEVHWYQGKNVGKVEWKVKRRFGRVRGDGKDKS